MGEGKKLLIKGLLIKVIIFSLFLFWFGFINWLNKGKLVILILWFLLIKNEEIEKFIIYFCLSMKVIFYVIGNKLGDYNGF